MSSASSKTTVATVKGSPLRAIGVVLLMVGGAGMLGAGVQYAQFFGGEVALAEVLRSDERVVGEVTSYRSLIRLKRPNGEVAEAYLDSRQRLSAAERLTVTYHAGKHREVVMGDGSQPRHFFWAFLGCFGVGLAMLIFAGIARRRKGVEQGRAA